MATKKDIAFEHFMRGSNPKKRKAISAKSQSFGSWGPTPGSFSASTAGAYFYPHVASKNLSYKIVKSGAKFLLYHDGKNFISEHTTIPLAKRSAAIHMRKNFSDEKPAPTRRLKKRRAKNTEPGYFPNPSQSGDIKLSDIEQLKYFVQEKTPSGWLATGAFHELEDAKEYATLMSESSNTSIRVVE